MPGVRVSTSAPSLAAFGGGEAVKETFDTAGKAAKDVMDIQIKEQQYANQLAVIDADNQLSNAENTILRDPNKGALNKRGKDAFGVPEQVNNDWSKATSDIESKLVNPEQKEAFRRMAVSRKVNIDKLMQVHVANEAQNYDNEVTNSFIDNEQNAAVTNYTDPQRVALSIGRQQAAIQDYAKRSGKSPEWTAQKTIETVSKTNASIVNRMLANGQDMLAKDYYEKNKDGFDGQTAAIVEKNLEEGTLRGESQRQADQIIKDYADLASAREAVRQIKDPQLRDAVDERVQKEFSIRSQQLQVNRDQMFLDATTALESSKSIDSIPPDKWNLLMPNQRAALRTLEKQLNDPGTQKQDDTVYVKYMGMSDSQLAKVTEAEIVENLRPNVTDEYYRQVTTRWSKVRESVTNAASRVEAKSMFNDKEMILNAMKSGKIGGVTDTDTTETLHKNKDKATAFRVFSDKVDAAFMSYKYSNGKEPDDANKKKIISNLLKDTVYVGGFFGGQEKPVATLTQEDLKRVYIPVASIPERVKIELVNIARANGQIKPNVTDDAAKALLRKKIEKAYATRVAGGSIEQVRSIMTER